MRGAQFAALLAVALSGTPAVAETDQAAAQGHYEAGVKAYQAGRFADAIDELKAADILRPSPALSFNLAQCFERQGDLGSARHYYEEYLQRRPDAEDRQAVQAKIAELEAKLRLAAPPAVAAPPAPSPPAAPAAPPVLPGLAGLAPTPEAAPRPEAPDAAEPPAADAPRAVRGRHLASWILLGAAGAGLITGGALNFAASQVDNGTGPFVQSTPQANNLWTGALIGYGVGAALGIAGAVAYLIESSP
jgi:tetratricopeptide (TPR) repeat protein